MSEDAGDEDAAGADAGREEGADAPEATSEATSGGAGAAGPGGALAAIARPTTEAPEEHREWRMLALPLAVLGALALYLLLTRPPPPPPAPQGARVRILLVEGAPELRLVLEDGWRLLPREGEAIPLESGTYALAGAGWTLARQADDPAAAPAPRELPRHDLRLAPVERGAGPAPAFGLGERRYRGELRLRRLDDGRVRAINDVELEDYLAGVIGHEMPLSWSDEALKAQAIAARSYAVRELKPARDYDLERDTRSQVYRGLMAEDARARNLVDATRGLVIKHAGQVVVAYFHSTCGGDTVPATWIFDWVKEDTPPLMGATECTCQPSKRYRWEQAVDLSKVKGITVKLPLKELRIAHHPRGLYVARVTLVGAEGQEQTWQGYTARGRLGLLAPAFEGELLEGGLQARFKGRGWGHGVGLCQFGAEGFAKKGWRAEQILTHFYPGVTVEPLERPAP